MLTSYVTMYDDRNWEINIDTILLTKDSGFHCFFPY